MDCKNEFKKRDHRGIKYPRHKPHLVVKWFHWPWRPRVLIHYYDKTMGEMRFTNVGKSSQ